LIIKIAETLEELAKCFILRYKVFVLEQGFDEEIEIDEFDNFATHFVAIDEDKVVGTLRLYKKNDGYILGRMAIDAAYRKKDIGRNLIKHTIEFVKRAGGKYIVAHAQVQALTFYEKCGFKKYGKEFLEEAVPHILVKYTL
jgi:predicted GNAT family N-acyltransferase